MRTKAVDRCLQCRGKLRGETLCPSCGYPTRTATSEARIEWEIAEWRKAHTPRSTTAPDPRIVRPLAEPRFHPAEPPESGAPVEPESAAAEPHPHGGRQHHRLRRKPRPVAIEIDLRVTEPAVTFQARAGRRLATLVLDHARVLMEPSGSGRKRWLPLEEVRAVRTTGRTLVIEGAIERIRIRHRDPKAVARMHHLVTAAVDQARRGLRHDPDVVQAWCELTSDLWKARLGRLKTRARKLGPFV